jgi:hypothetical protein
MNFEHPVWCDQRRCRVAVQGTHKSQPVEMTHGAQRATAWLRQVPGECPMLALVVAYRTIGGPVVFVPWPDAREFIDTTMRLLAQVEQPDEEPPAVGGCR